MPQLSINKQLAFADTLPSSPVKITTPEAVLEGSVSAPPGAFRELPRVWGRGLLIPAPGCVRTSRRPRACPLGCVGADSVADAVTD